MDLIIKIIYIVLIILEIIRFIICVNEVVKEKQQLDFSAINQILLLSFAMAVYMVVLG